MKIVYCFYKLICIVLILFTACLRPAKERALLDQQAGKASGYGIDINIEGGLACIRELISGSIKIWSQAPAISMVITSSGTSVEDWSIEVMNSMPGSMLTGRTKSNAGIVSEKARVVNETDITWNITLPRNEIMRIKIAPNDADIRSPFRFAVVGDTHFSMNSGNDLLKRIKRDRSIRFVLSTGDVTHSGQWDEYTGIQREILGINVPFFSTSGNHDIDRDVLFWHKLFGRFNVHFIFKGVYFTLVDSSSSTIDPIVYNWLDSWLAGAAGGVHVFGTHYPPLDPAGIKKSTYPNRKEGAKLLAKLVKGHVDIAFFGHIHTYYAFTDIGIPAYISGGGGSLQGMSGYGRHYLVVDVNPESGVAGVNIIQID